MPALRAWSFALMLLWVFPVGTHAQEERKKYNVLFIAVDDLNNDMGSYDHPMVQTPNIDRLAARAVRFNKAYCQYPLCNPSRASVLTGLNPDITGVYDLGTRFRKNIPDVITLPQLFMKHGYYSARVGKIYHYGVPGGIGTNGLDDPASWNEVFNPSGRDRREEGKLTRLLPRKVGLGVNLAFLEAEGADEEQTDGMVATRAIRMLESHRSVPFFIAVGFFRPHLPFIAPKKYYDPYPLEKIRLPHEPVGVLDDIPEPALFTKPANWGLTEMARKQSIRGYYASVSFMDAQVGRVLDALDSLGLSDNTIVVLWSDHGYNLGEHGQWEKRSLFEKSARVPLLISVPGGTKGKTSERTVELVDLYPTLAELCGLPISQKLSGVSLKTLLDNPGAPWEKPAYSQVSLGDSAGIKVTMALSGYSGGSGALKSYPMSVMGRSVRTERWRYTEWDEGRLGIELYDEKKDSSEWTNLAESRKYRKVVRELSQMLKAHFP